MQDKSDAQLLRDYARQGNEAAFREIVLRHTDLIYSAALRQVASPDLAGDVTQSVFSDLARKAPALAETVAENASILGWLYRSTRFVALNQLREERRRHEREREAMEQLSGTSEPTQDWNSLSPVLDEAMAELNEADREAILLRFFKNHNFQQVGKTLGVSDDTAQKRVSRALEKLRTQLQRRGVAMSGVALATLLSANAVQAAPIGLTAAVASVAVISGTLQTTGTISAGKILIMTTAQKALVGTALVVALGTALYQTYRASELENRVQSIQQQGSVSSTDDDLRAQLAEAESRLLAAEQENGRLRQQNGEVQKLRGDVSRMRSETQQKSVDPSDVTAMEAVAWKKRVETLKNHLQENPHLGIPELQLVTEKDWLDAARGNLETELDFRRAMASLRNNAQSKFSHALYSATQKYMEASNKAFPTDVAQLRPYFDSPVDESMLARYAIIPSSQIASLGMGGDTILTQKSAVDEEFDSRNGIGPSGYGSTGGAQAWNESLIAAQNLLKPAMQAYAAANPGKNPSHPDELLPYLTTAEQKEAFERLKASASGNVTRQ